MHGEIITIGDELISGKIMDLNARYAAGRLTSVGFWITCITTVGDNEETVSKALFAALSTASFIIITGGLGPTDDDMTNQFVSSTLNRILHLDQEMLDLIKQHMEAIGLEMTPSAEKMAWIPEGARLLNPQGRFCGCCIEENGVPLYFLPGVPDQMRYLLDKFVIPELLKIYPNVPAADQRVLKLYGVSEPVISETLKKIRGKTGDVVLGFYPRFPEIHITLSLKAKDHASVTRELDRVESEIRNLLNPYIFGAEKDEMEAVVGNTLLKKGLTIALAESCSGGLIGHRLTNVAGSSTYFQGGTVVYSNQSKMDLLGVSPDTLERHGAVSEETVREMVAGVMKRFKTDLGLAVTGIAGPEGGTEKKPVGTVYIGLAAEKAVYALRYRFPGNRSQVKMHTAHMAMDCIRRYLNGSPFLPGI